MGLKRHRPNAMHALSCLTLTGSAIVSAAAPAVSTPGQLEVFAGGSSQTPQRLGVIVPAHRGDLPRAVSSLERWPVNCSPITLQNVDLVLYYAESDADEAAAAAVPAIAESAGRCFANTKIVYANLDEEDDVYPRGPSVQFYKMFLDEDVRPHLAEYDALAIIEWDVLVASDDSFAELYKAAFGSDEFWVKGSNLEGTNFHASAAVQDMWHVLGHINGNAIYNNNDNGFVEFVDYTRARWDYRYPYDVALWATISDFPYSWPLWQRYSSKFVTTNLISNVGYEHVDHESVADAVKTKTLFIHGSHVDDGNVESIKDTRQKVTGRRSLRAEVDVDVACEAVCGGTASGLPVGTSTVCDKTCDDSRFDGYLCGAGKSSKFGASCRLCYTDVKEARKRERLLRASEHGEGEAKHVIMCDTMRPPEAEECSQKCSLKHDTVCDESCGSGRYGDYNCNWREHGLKCRYCFDDVEVALAADQVAMRHNGRVVMCDTMEPPRSNAIESVENTVDRRKAQPARRLQKWRDNQKWKDLDKWKGDDETEPKWKTNQKWKNNRCDDGCEYTSQDGTKGRICDDSCKDGEPYGRNGCSAKQGLFGRYCRVCYNDEDKALEADSEDDRAIMCATGEPVTVYVNRRLTPADSERVAGAPRKLQKWRDNQKWKDLDKWKGDDETEPKWKTNQKWKNNRCDDGCEYTSQDGTKGRICDDSCKDGDPYGRNGCSAKQGLFGRYCRVCYNDEDKALEADSEDDRAIMCATGEPVTVYVNRQLSPADSERVAGAPRKLQKWRDNQKWKDLDKWKGDDETEPKWKTNQKWKNNRCDDGCEYTSQDGTKGRICDDSCKDGDPYGRNGCSAKQGLFGRYCRVCYNDEDKALEADSEDDRAIMCATGEPVTVYVNRRLAPADSERVAGAPRKLQKWRDNQKWKDLDKWKGDDETEPKWKTNQKWKNNRCDDGCEYTSQDGTKGRICDDSCKDGDPYGRNGCSAKQGLFGRYCRVCYNDEDKALEADSEDDRAIMCATGEPVTVYVNRRLSPADSERVAGAPRKLQKWRDNQKWKDLDKWKGDDETEPKWKTNQKWKNNRCDDGCEYTSQDGTKGRICDDSCKDGDPYGRNGCSAKQGLFGRYCRVCYNDEDKALEADSEDDRAIMCATGEPVTVYVNRRLAPADSERVAGAPRKLQKWRDNQKWKDLDKWKGDDETEPKWKTNQKWKNNRCDDGCEYTSQDGTKGRICDDSCKDGDPYGRNGCSAKQGLFGRYCRVCYNDEDKALEADSEDDRAIMCATGEPVTVYVNRRLSPADSERVAGAPRKLQKWRDNQKWKDLDKWKGDDETEPKWKTNQKWKNNRCDDGCEYTSQDGTKGRICDDSCKDGDPYGRNGCSAKQGLFGRYCRVCYNDEDKALEADSEDDRAIMCETGLPVTVYSRRLLRSTQSLTASAVGGVGETGETDEFASFIAEASKEPFTADLTRGNICVFLAGGADDVMQMDQSVQSILDFVPGVRVAVAADIDSLDAYERSVGCYPGVKVSGTQSVRSSSLFADTICGEGTSIIYYMRTGSVLSRTFSAKDTHSPRGDLLVVYGDSRNDFHDSELARQTTEVLGFKAPSFTHGTELMLPVQANSDLRAELISGRELDGEDANDAAFHVIESFDKISVPQVLAALAYARNTAAVWFLNPSTWVTNHLFKTASIWDIPLVKPRFSCELDRSARSSKPDAELADTLSRNIELFKQGGSCESGFIAPEM